MDVSSCHPSHISTFLTFFLSHLCFFTINFLNLFHNFFSKLLSQPLSHLFSRTFFKTSFSQPSITRHLTLSWRDYLPHGSLPQHITFTFTRTFPAHLLSHLFHTFFTPFSHLYLSHLLSHLFHIFPFHTFHARSPSHPSFMHLSHLIS